MMSLYEGKFMVNLKQARARVGTALPGTLTRLEFTKNYLHTTSMFDSRVMGNCHTSSKKYICAAVLYE